ncbi:hypothetical protein SAMN05421812_101738 [Asanoa hainanensis]|uniref:Secreted protein n=1 Tax=Asanoa hainanensis TaxID=560556 RepID=A0A239H7Z7_9ACTN|nr:hypothetical protein SAMN05421812_101738 [Asanoa hainanensis]
MRKLMAAVAAICAGFALAMVGGSPALAQSSGDVSILSTRCTERADLNPGTYFGVSCSTDLWTPWQAFKYRARIQCSDGAQYSGPWRHSITFSSESRAVCPFGTRTSGWIETA